MRMADLPMGHVMWEQPPFFSTGAPHLGHGLVVRCLIATVSASSWVLSQIPPFSIHLAMCAQVAGSWGGSSQLAQYAKAHVPQRTVCTREPPSINTTPSQAAYSTTAGNKLSNSAAWRR